MPVKRKSVGTGTLGNAKRAKNDAHENAKGVVAEVIYTEDDFWLSCDVGDEDSVRKSIVELAKYAHTSPEEIAEEVKRISVTIVRGIKRQMSWKPSCKTNSSRFILDGICPDPLVFSTLLQIEYPPTFKQKKISSTDFQNNVGKVQAHARYHELYIASKEVLLRYNAESGEFKISGDYGISGWRDPERW